MKKLWFPAAIILLTLITTGPSLHFSINGDDWLALYRYNSYFKTFWSYFDPSSYANPSANYVFGYLMMGIISKLFSYNPFPYYFVALILRIMTAFSFYIAVYTATKNKWAGYLSAIFFSSTYAGIETTNWVSNMNTYASIILLNIFIKLFYSKQDLSISPKTFLQSLTLVVSFLITPVRLHGLIFFIPLIIVLSTQKLDKKSIMNSLMALLVLLVPLVIVRLLTYPGSSSDYLVSISKQGQIIGMVGNLASNIGSSILPALLISHGNPQNSLNLAVGILTILLLGIYFFSIRKLYPSFFRLGLLSLGSAISFLIVPGLVNPTSIFPSDHRYLIIPASWLMVALALTTVSLYKRSSSFKSLAVFITLIIIFLNCFALIKYFSIMSNEGRLAKDSDRVFDYVNSHVNFKYNGAPLVFLFVSNDNLFLYNAANFGFTPHMLVINPDLSADTQKAPFTVDSLKSLEEILEDPNNPELARYGYKPVKIPLGNVYSFYADQSQILDYTAQVRESVVKDLSSNTPEKR